MGKGWPQAVLGRVFLRDCKSGLDPLHLPQEEIWRGHRKGQRDCDTGYNGAPRGSANCVDRGICRRKELNVPAGERYELCEAVHAEQNAIINGSPSA